MLARWAKLEKVIYNIRLEIKQVHYLNRILSVKVVNLTSVRFQTFMTVSNMTCYTTGILTRLVGHVCHVLLSHSHLGLEVAYDLYIQSMHLADLVMPQEYGITREEKIEIAGAVCQPLLHKINMDITNTVSNIGTDIMHQLDPKYEKNPIFS